MSLIGTLTSGVSALRSFTKGLEVIGNNIANVNTTAFKASTVSFAESFSNTLQSSSPSGTTASNSSSMQVGTGVKISKIESAFTQGALAPTGVGTDLSVSGNGFFHVRNNVDDATYATRDGAFRSDDQGYIVTPLGYRLQGLTGGSSGTSPTTVGDIQVGANTPSGLTMESFTISRQGEVIETYSDGTQATTGQILLQGYLDPSALQRVGENLFTNFTAAGAIGGTALTASNNKPSSNGLGEIEAGTLELSNVDLTEQFANMITTQRSFQASSRLVTVSDSVLEEVVNLKR